jgi:hypothetical protein
VIDTLSHWTATEWSANMGVGGYSLRVVDRGRAQAGIMRTEADVYLAFEVELREAHD